MINWCAYCQKFLGEIPPLEDRRFSHGLCASCATAGLDISDEQFARTKYLQDLNGRFWSAAKDENHAEMIRLADEGISENIRPIDILFGIAGPLLYKVGELWAKNEITYHEEQRFTRSCETLIELVSQRAEKEKDSTRKSDSGTVLLSNVKGNIHTLGLQFVSLGLQSLGIYSKVILPALKPEALVSLALLGNFQVIGLSIALTSQSLELEKVISAFNKEKAFNGKIIVGGVAISEKHVSGPNDSNVYYLPSPCFNGTEKELWITK